jgi:hypothetical protein
VGAPNILVYVALVAFVLGTAWCFSALDGPRAATVSLFGGWLFVPYIDGRISVGLLHTKGALVPAVALVASLVFDSARWASLRTRLLDLPVALVCFGPFVTSLGNDLGLNEAVAATLDMTMTWGAPYVLGRLYLANARGMRVLAAGYVIAALVYAPLCWWEIRMAPNLNYDIFGYRLGMFRDSLRASGYRPNVFMQHALAVAIFMATATVTAFWLWRSRAAIELLPIPPRWAFGVLFATTILCKSSGSVTLMLVGMAVLEGSRRWRTSVLVAVLAVVPPLICTVRISGWTGDTLVKYSRRAFGEERAASLGFRLANENALIPKALQRPWLGWGRTGGSFLFDPETHERVSVVDSMWIIILGFYGLAGLVGLYATISAPPVWLLRTYPARLWADPRLAPTAAVATVLLVWAVDDLNNAMMSPAYPAMSGALVGLLGAARSGRRPSSAASGTRRRSAPGPGAAAARAGT